MPRRLFASLLSLALAVFPSALAAAETTDADEKGFEVLFDGKSLDNWTLVNKAGPGYVIEGDVLVCPADGGGNLFTKQEYSDFVLRFEVRISPGGNNGVGIRAPLKGDPAYQGMEIQILDDDADVYKNIQPWQHHGSVYGVVASKPGALKKAGEWNVEEIRCEGRHVKVTLNDKVIVDANLDDVKDPEILKAHPGMNRKSGYIGFLGHGTKVEFRKIRLKDLTKESK